MKKKVLLFSLIGVVLVAIAVVVIVLVTNNKNKKNTETEARVIVITEILKNTEDAKVSITNNGNTTTASVGLRLKSGDNIKTDSDSVVYFTCDNDKVFRLSHNSEIEISTSSKNKLGVTLLDGDIYFNVKNKLKDDEELDVVAGSTTMSVRGTIGDIVYDKDNGELQVTVPEGKLSCKLNEKEEFATPGVQVITAGVTLETTEVELKDYPVNLLFEITKDEETLDRVVTAFKDIVENVEDFKQEIIEQAEIFKDGYNFDIVIHKHEFSEFKFDSEYHYKECSCGETENREKHTFTFDPTNTTDKLVTVKCNVCGYEKTVENPYYKEETVVSKTYKITYTDDDKIETVEFEEGKFPELLEPTKEGYTFIGWFEGEALVEKITENRDYNLVALWGKDKEYYKINYINAFDETLVIEFEEGKFPELIIPTREGYKFLGWFEDEKEVKAITENRNYDLVASWESEVNIYTINYNLGEEKKEVHFEENKFPKLLEPTKDGFNFLGWFENDKEVTVISENRDYNLVASWERIPQTYTIRYNNVTEEAIVVEFEENKFPEIMIPERECCTFLGWADMDFIGVSIGCYNDPDAPQIEEPSTNYVMVTEINENRNYNLLALWEEEKETYNIYLTDGETTQITFVKDEFPELLRPSKEGYNFLGWFENDKEVTEITENRDYNLEARWEEILEVFYIYYTDGETIEETFTKDNFPKLMVPSKDGYVFLGWFENGKEVKVINENRNYNLVASWEEENNTYTISFSFSGINRDGYQVEFTTNKFPSLEDASEEGYVFLGWFENGAKVEAITENRNYSLVGTFDIIRPKLLNAELDVNRSITNLSLSQQFIINYPYMDETIYTRENNEYVGHTFQELCKVISEGTFADAYYVYRDPNYSVLDFSTFIKAATYYNTIFNFYGVVENGEFRFVESYQEYLDNIDKLYLNSGSKIYQIAYTKPFYDGDCNGEFDKNNDVPLFVFKLTWESYISEEVTPSYYYGVDNYKGYNPAVCVYDILTNTVVGYAGSLTGVISFDIYGLNVDVPYTFDSSFLYFQTMHMELGKKVSDYFNPNNIPFTCLVHGSYLINAAKVTLINEDDYDRVIGNEGPFAIPVKVTPIEGYGQEIVSYIRIIPTLLTNEVPWPDNITIKINDLHDNYNFEDGNYAYVLISPASSLTVGKNIAFVACTSYNKEDYYNVYIKEMTVIVELEDLTYFGSDSFEGNVGDYVSSIELSDDELYTASWLNPEEVIKSGENTYKIVLTPLNEYVNDFCETIVEVTITGVEESSGVEYNYTLPTITDAGYLENHYNSYINQDYEGGTWEFFDAKGVYDTFGKTTVKMKFIPDDLENYVESIVDVPVEVGQGRLVMNDEYYPYMVTNRVHIGDETSSVEVQFCKMASYDRSVEVEGKWGFVDRYIQYDSVMASMVYINLVFVPNDEKFKSYDYSFSINNKVTGISNLSVYCEEGYPTPVINYWYETGILHYDIETGTIKVTYNDGSTKDFDLNLVTITRIYGNSFTLNIFGCNTQTISIYGEIKQIEAPNGGN